MINNLLYIRTIKLESVQRSDYHDFIIDYNKEFNEIELQRPSKAIYP